MYTFYTPYHLLLIIHGKCYRWTILAHTGRCINSNFQPQLGKQNGSQTYWLIFTEMQMMPVMDKVQKEILNNTLIQEPLLKKKKKKIYYYPIIWQPGRRPVKHQKILMKKDQEVLIVMKRALPLIFLHCFAVEVRNIKFLVWQILQTYKLRILINFSRDQDDWGMYQLQSLPYSSKASQLD